MELVGVDGGVELVGGMELGVDGGTGWWLVSSI